MKSSIESLLSKVPNPIAKTFAYMSIAEEEIAAAKKRQPRKVEKIHGAFKWLIPGEVLRNKSDRLYEAHVRELIARVAAGQDPVPLTKAEVLAELSDASLAAPLGARSAALMAELFNELGLGEIEPTPEPWKGSSQELLGEMRRTGRLPNPRRDIK